MLHIYIYSKLIVIHQLETLFFFPGDLHTLTLQIPMTSSGPFRNID